MSRKAPDLDRIFHALADPTRRAVLERLSVGPASVSELAAPFSMALPTLMQHLDVLETSVLVRSFKSGRIRTYQLTQQPLEAGEQWFVSQRNIWEKRLNQLDDYLYKLKEKQK